MQGLQVGFQGRARRVLGGGGSGSGDSAHLWRNAGFRAVVKLSHPAISPGLILIIPELIDSSVVSWKANGSHAP